MKQVALNESIGSEYSTKSLYFDYLLVFLGGLIGPLGFAPFHMPGLTILGLSLLFFKLLQAKPQKAFYLGFSYGFGFFGLGVSWVINSIHDYGQLNYFLSALATLLFITYLSLFPALTSYFFSRLCIKSIWNAPFLRFAALWCLSECLRATLMTGFPWLLMGTSLIDTPLKNLAPVVGIYGLSFLCVFAAGLLTVFFNEQSNKRYVYLLSFILLLTGPGALESTRWTSIQKKSISIGAVQANLSMRDKWDEALFWNLLSYYEKAINTLLGKQLIILPESAIPLPARYLQDYLHNLDQKALKANSALVLGILQPTDDNETHYYNAIMTLGRAEGNHIKQQLVPFGEYIPAPFAAINHWLNLPEPNILAGGLKQPLITILNHPVASLICYEIAYPTLLRAQMPKAQWIISISDNGWFGKSLASYQQLQMSQMLSLLTGRYQVVVNNDGLSSVINDKGEIVEGLPPFASGTLQAEMHPATGSTPWILWSNYPIIVFCTFYLLIILVLRFRKLEKQ